MSKNQSDETSYPSKINTDGLIEILLEGAEAGIDSLLKDSAFALIPGASIVGYALKIPSTLANSLFEKAATKFASAKCEADFEEWKTWTEKISQKEGGLDRAGEVLLRFLNTTDDSKKAHALGLVYAASARGKITVDEMYRMQMILDRIYWNDLEEFALIVHKYGESIDEPYESHIFLGLLNRRGVQTLDDIGGPDYGDLSDIGRKLLSIIAVDGHLR